MHGIERAINLDRLGERFAGALQKAWCAATCWEGCRPAYPADGSNPAFGNCAVSVLAAWAAEDYRADIIPCLAHVPGQAAIPHYQLCDDGVIIDPTAQQFPPGTVIEPIEPGDPRHREMLRGFFDEAADHSLRGRMTLLLGRMIELGDYRTDASADYVVDRLRGALQARFSSVRKCKPKICSNHNIWCYAWVTNTIY